ncbi:Hypothetical_protein [Hexamita inflata]|uniref:Hypothetical_protein n=1 Tax=Hexamita inflata TaxID=28002 RepID=A0AA86QTZ0_9EUKA|nr:Hypothetical protein HINF_LOCUS46914 [Hexamita inflata]
MLTLFFTLYVQVQNRTLSEKQTASYLDIGTIYGLEIKVGLPQQYQIADSKSQLEINATDFSDVFMCISSTLMEPETAVCELQITAKGKYDLSPGLKYVLLYSTVANKIVIFSANIKVSQLVHQEQTKITLLKDIITFANAQVNLQSLNDQSYRATLFFRPVGTFSPGNDLYSGEYNFQTGKKNIFNNFTFYDYFTFQQQLHSFIQSKQYQASYYLQTCSKQLQF